MGGVITSTLYAKTFGQQLVSVQIEKADCATAQISDLIKQQMLLLLPIITTVMH